MEVAVPKLCVHIRWAIRRDTPSILETERVRFGEHAWDEQELVAVLRKRNCIGMVAECGDKVVGHMVYELRASAIHLLTLAVAAGCDHRGVGSQLVAKLKSKLSPNRRKHIELEVRETNLGAQRFFKAQGFRAVAVLRGWYQEIGYAPLAGEDAYRMRLTYDAGAEVIERILSGEARTTRTLEGADA